MSQKSLPEAQDSDVDFILEKHKEKLSIPPIDPSKKQIFLCPVGLMGSGKSTIIKKLAKKLSMVVISGDAIRATLLENGFSSRNKAWEIGRRLTVGFVSKGYSVATDSDCASLNTIEGIEVLEREYGVLPIWIHITAPEHVILERLRNYPNPWLFDSKEQIIEVYKTRKSLHENLDFPFSYVFDTSKDTVDKQIEEAYGLIEEQR